MMHPIKTIADLPSHPDPMVLGLALKQVHEVFEKLADQYGKLFTVQFANKPMLVVADTKLINFVLCKRPELFGPYVRNSNMLAAIKADGIETADNNEWKRQRAVVAASMESAYLSQYFGNISAVTEDLKNHWVAFGDSLAKTDLEAEIFGFAISVFTALVFGDMAGMPADERELARERLYTVIAILGKRIDALLPQMHLESFSGDKDFDTQIQDIYRTIANIIAHNRTVLGGENGTGKAVNLLQVFMVIMAEQGLDICTAKLIENILQILLASESTTANTLLRVLHRLAVNPHVQKDVQDEVAVLLGQHGTIDNIKDIKKLKCLEAVIYETMRMESVSRLVIMETKADVLLDDVAIPCGTPLILLIAYGALDEENFHQAKDFDHRRWLGESKAQSVQHNNKAFLGFGAGPRSCPGRGLAMLVMKTVLAMICGNFQIRPVADNAAAIGSTTKDQPSPLGFTIESREWNQGLNNRRIGETEHVY